MKVAVVTGSCGLVGSETCKSLHADGYAVVGIDNDMRRYFFGQGASTSGTRARLESKLGNYTHEEVDIRNWAAKEPLTDFGVNATGTLHLLEATRLHAPGAVFIFTSTNKVYGDTSNRLPLVELDTRWEIAPEHAFHDRGIDETMSLDTTQHSIFGAGKVAADVMVQEYGRYFGLKTGVFRCGCITGPAHAGAELHGFLSYLMKCTVTGKAYSVFGYQGKQVRDNIHSADLVNAFQQFIKAPRPGEVYNMGGSRHSNCSMIEAIVMCEKISGNRLSWTYQEDNRIGDHIWWISDVTKFQAHYPQWQYRHDLRGILTEIHAACVK